MMIKWYEVMQNKNNYQQIHIQLRNNEAPLMQQRERVNCDGPRGVLLLPWNGLWQQIWFSPDCAQMETCSIFEKKPKTFCHNSVNLFEMRVRKLEGNIKGYPRGNLPYLRTWTFFFFFCCQWNFLAGAAVQMCKCVCVSGRQTERGSLLLRREKRLVLTSPQCLWTIGLVLTWQHEC